MRKGTEAAKEEEDDYNTDLMPFCYTQERFMDLCQERSMEGILNERMMSIIDKSVGDEQGGFRKGRGCVNQNFAVKILVEKYLDRESKRTERT